MNGWIFLSMGFSVSQLLFSARKSLKSDDDCIYFCSVRSAKRCMVKAFRSLHFMDLEFSFLQAEIHKHFTFELFCCLDIAHPYLSTLSSVKIGWYISIHFSVYLKKKYFFSLVIRCGSTHLNGCQKQKSLNRAHRTHSKGETHTQQTQPDKNIISTTMETRFLVVYIIRFQFMRGDWFSTNKFYFRLKSRRNLWKTICIPTKHLVGAFFFLDSPGFEWKLILLTVFNCLFRFFLCCDSIVTGFQSRDAIFTGARKWKWCSLRMFPIRCFSSAFLRSISDKWFIHTYTFIAQAIEWVKEERSATFWMYIKDLKTTQQHIQWHRNKHTPDDIINW